MNKQIFSSLVLIGDLALPSVSAANLLDDTVDQESAAFNAAAKSQVKVDKIYQQKTEAIQDLRLTRAEIDQLKVYNKQLKAIISDQNKQMVSFEKQLKDIEVTQRGIMPLMERMLTMLDQFIDLDLPFLLDERQSRIAKLRALLLSSEITISEKFRRVMEAYQIELEFGKTIEAYRAKGPNGKIVDFLRVGRVGLYYVLLNSGGAYAWDSKSSQWIELDGSYKASLAKGIQIARKQSAPSLFNLQLPSLQEIK